MVVKKFNSKFKLSYSSAPPTSGTEAIVRPRDMESVNDGLIGDRKCLRKTDIAKTIAGLLFVLIVFSPVFITGLVFSLRGNSKAFIWIQKNEKFQNHTVAIQSWIVKGEIQDSVIKGALTYVLAPNIEDKTGLIGYIDRAHLDQVSTGKLSPFQAIIIHEARALPSNRTGDISSRISTEIPVFLVLTKDFERIRRSEANENVKISVDVNQIKKDTLVIFN